MTLDRVNEAFHGSYDDERADAATSDPILVVLANELVLFRGSERTTFLVSMPEFTTAKAVAHAPVALWLLLHRSGEETEKRLAELRAFIMESPADPILSETLRWMDRMPFDLDEFAAAFGPRLMASIEHATKLQLDALHRTTEQALATLTAAERHALHVAVTGDHQARIRSLPMQYFQKRFTDSDRVLYAEGVADAEAAAALVGKQRLDRAMAEAFFGNPRRMQRDLLGDAAKAELARVELARIDE